MTIGAKVDHVRAAMGTGTGGHHCHWPGCPAEVEPARWGCSKHWYMLPKDLRSRIWADYKPGQEETKTPSREYLLTARAVQEWIAGYVQHFPQHDLTRQGKFF